MKLLHQATNSVAPVATLMLVLVARPAFSDEPATTTDPEHARYLIEKPFPTLMIDSPEEVITLSSRWLDDNKEGKDRKEHGEMLFRRAEAHWRLGQTDPASRDYEAAARTLGNDPRVVWGKAKVLATTKPDQASKLLEELVKAHPEFSRAYINLAKLRFDQHDCDAALDYCNKALAAGDVGEDPFLKADIFATRANVFYKLKRWRQVLDDTHRSIQLNSLADSKAVNRYTLLMEAHFNLGEYRSAEIAAAKALMLDRENNRARYLLWKARVRQHEYESAWRLAKKLAGAVPSIGADAEVIWASSCNLLGLYDEGLEHARRGAEDKPNSALIAKEMAIAFEGLKDYEHADSSFTRALDLDRKYETLLGRAFFLLNCPDVKFRNAQKAAELAAEASRASSDDKDWRWALALGQARAEVGEFDKATAVIEEVRKDSHLPSEARAEFEAALSNFRRRLPYRSLQNLAGHGR
jgi:tetratricopeptide (TPR) repeat protein